MGDLLERFGGHSHGLSNRTINRYASSLASLFKWARRRGYFEEGENPFAEQSRPKARKTGWEPYSVDELNTLLTSLPADAPMQWLPRIALFSGMRLGEICRLRTEDVKCEDKIWFFDVTDDAEGRGLKTKAARRRAPIHSALIKAGFLKYWRALPSGSLFPELKPGGPDGKLSWYFTRRFTAYRRGVGITRPRVSFHSFRKTATTALDNAGVRQADVAALIGHARGFTFDVYSKGLELERLRGVVERINYPGLDPAHFSPPKRARRGTT